MQVVIRTEAHPDIGLGHLMRMLALAEWLQFHQVRAVVVLTRFGDRRFTDAFVSHVESRIEQYGLELHWSPEMNPQVDAQVTKDACSTADWFVLDSYRLGQEWLDTMKAAGARTCVLDDHPKLQRLADLTVDPTPFSRRGSITDNTIFAGAHYFFAAPELARRHFLLEPQNRNSRFPPRRWFVSFGGTDVKAMLPHTLYTLGEVLHVDAQVDIAVNPSVAHMAEIRAACKSLNSNTRLIHESNDIIDALNSCDFAIGAAGGMTLERALLGAPSLITQVADNQEDIYRRLGEEQLSYTLCPEAFGGGGALKKKLTEILEDADSWVAMRERCLSITQGLGAGWLAQFFCQHKNNGIYLCCPTWEFRERLFMWQSVPEVRRYSRNPTAPTWEEHCAWYQKRTESPNSIMAEIRYHGSSVGMLRLDHKNSAPLQFEVSILIAPDFHGRGIAPMALRLARRLVPFGEFLAYIQPGNRASLRAFAAAGFQPSPQPDYFRREAIYANSH